MNISSPRLLLLTLGFPLILTATSGPGYEQRQLSDKFFSEGAVFADLNSDGQPDAIAGPFWYEGPTFAQRHEIYRPAPFDPLGYSDNFLTFSHDFNGDGWADVLVLGYPGIDASWFENPGLRDLPWRRRVVFLPVDGESPVLGDLLGSGYPVLICASGGRLGYAAADPRDAVRPWTFHPISPLGLWNRFTHGLGFGDLNGDGRADILEKNGWWQQPASLVGDPVWEFHPYPFATAPAPGGAQMLVTDVNGDGLADVVTSRHAHGYGLSWFEQIRAADGAINFSPHVILSENPDTKISGVQFAQLHALALADVDGDGLPDIITGKRWWAHGPKGDADPAGAPVLYAFLTRRAPDRTVTFEPRLLDDNSGIGTQVSAADVNADGRADFIVGNKRGTFVVLSTNAVQQK